LDKSEGETFWKQSTQEPLSSIIHSADGLVAFGLFGLLDFACFDQLCGDDFFNSLFFVDSDGSISITSTRFSLLKSVLLPSK
jgi:hypothetical protein